MTKAALSVMVQLRQSGASLQQIAGRFGISRERVRQLLVKHCGSTQVHDLLGAQELARKAGCSRNYILKLRRRGIIQPSMVVGGKRTLWKPETVDIIIGYKTSHRCRVCNRPLPDNHWVYCSRRCWIEAYRHRYLNMPEEARRLHNERVARWQNTHPEEAKDIRRRMHKKYAAKKSMERMERYESSLYVIRARCPIPLGTVVKVHGSGKTKGRAEVKWCGRPMEIPWCCLKRMQLTANIEPF